jgi:hypothetical protein
VPDAKLLPETGENLHKKFVFFSAFAHKATSTTGTSPTLKFF